MAIDGYMYMQPWIWLHGYAALASRSNSISTEFLGVAAGARFSVAWEAATYINPAGSEPFAAGLSFSLD